MAWQRALSLNPTLHLHHADDRHASPTGSYLAAGVFYAAILKASPVGLPGSFEIQGKSRPDVPRDEALFLQQVAWDTIMNSR